MFEQPAVQRFIAQARRQSYRPRQLILRGSEGGQLCLLLEGGANLMLEHDSGEQALLCRLHPGDFFGEDALGSARGDPALSVRARGVAVVAGLGCEAFRRLVLEEPALSLALIDQLAGRLSGSRRQLADRFFLDVTERLRRTLAALCREPEAHAGEHGTAIRINRQELAAMIGCSREMIARGLRTLESEGLIRADGHVVVVQPALFRTP